MLKTQKYLSPVMGRGISFGALNRSILPLQEWQNGSADGLYDLHDVAAVFILGRAQ
jgi:hypothetical protein